MIARKLRQVFIYVFARVLVFVSVTSMFAQTPDTATILGRVSDLSQAVVSGAQITVKNNQTGLRRTAKTDATGKFSIAGLPVTGNYDLTASKAGFNEAHVPEIALIGGRQATVDLRLNVSGESTAVEVTGVVGEVLTDEPELGERIGSKQAQETPLLNRRITYLPLLNSANRPAINQGDAFMNENLFTTSGAGRRQTTY